MPDESESDLIKEFVASDTLSAKIEVPEPRFGASIFVVAGHKTGSVLLTRVIDDMAEAAGLPAIPVEGSVWRQGFSIKDWPAELYDFLNQSGYIFYSFRWLQKLPEVPAFSACKKLFMVRDPRDIAVSYYFSMAKSHGLPKSGKSRETIAALRREAESIDIDEFIQSGKVGPILRNIERFSDFYGDERSVFFKYEDIIFEKRKWVRQIASEIGAELSGHAADAIADKHDVWPEKEDPNAHIRSVKPGGYLEKISSDSVAYIKEMHPVFFGLYGYE